MKTTFSIVGTNKLQTLRNKGPRCSPSISRRCSGLLMAAAYVVQNQAGRNYVILNNNFNLSLKNISAKSMK